MTQREYTTSDGIVCDVTGCDSSLIVERGNPWAVYKLLQQIAPLEGWSRYVGRGHRDYCPDHAPRPGHKMRRVWGPAAEQGTT